MSKLRNSMIAVALALALAVPVSTQAAPAGIARKIIIALGSEVVGNAVWDGVKAKIEALFKKDPQAKDDIRRQAEAGDAGAQFALGRMYHEGLGVPQNDRQAMFWYREAAEQGHAGAKNALNALANGQARAAAQFDRGVSGQSSSWVNPDTGKLPNLPGYIIGNEMDKYDRQQLNHMYERGVSGQSSSWVNPDTGNQYAVTPQPAYQQDNRWCRQAEIDSVIDGRRERAMTTACRTPAGRWELQQR